MDYKISLSIIIALSLASLFFIGNGITGMVTGDVTTKSPDLIAVNNNNIFIGLIFLMVLVIFALTVYEKWIVQADKEPDDNTENNEDKFEELTLRNL